MKLNVDQMWPGPWNPSMCMPWAVVMAG